MLIKSSFKRTILFKSKINEMNEDEEHPVLKDSDTKRHNKTVVIQTRQEIKKVHSHRHSDSSQKKSNEKHHHHHHDSRNEEHIQKENQQDIQIRDESKETKNNSNHVRFHHQQSDSGCSKEKEELRKWKTFADHIIDMLLMSLPKSEIPTVPQAGKMAAIETLCSTACKLLHDPSQNPKYQELEKKYNKCKSQMKSMRKKCSQLYVEVQKNQQMLYQHMLSIQKKEETAVEKKLHNLESILAEQYKMQQIQFANLDDFDYNMSQRQQLNTSKKSPPRIQSNRIIKTKKIVKVANNHQSNQFISDIKDENETSSDSSTENDNNNSNNFVSGNSINHNSFNSQNKIIILEEEDEEDGDETSSNMNINQQTIQITKTTTLESS